MVKLYYVSIVLSFLKANGLFVNEQGNEYIKWTMASAQYYKKETKNEFICYGLINLGIYCMDSLNDAHDCWARMRRTQLAADLRQACHVTSATVNHPN